MVLRSRKYSRYMNNESRNCRLRLSTQCYTCSSVVFIDCRHLLPENNTWSVERTTWRHGSVERTTPRIKMSAPMPVAVRTYVPMPVTVRTYVPMPVTVRMHMSVSVPVSVRMSNCACGAQCQCHNSSNQKTYDSLFHNQSPFC